MDKTAVASGMLSASFAELETERRENKSKGYPHASYFQAKNKGSGASATCGAGAGG